MNVLIVKLSSLGDLMHALPAVHCLKTGLGATLDWAVQAEYAELVRCVADVDDVIPVPRRETMRRGRAFLRALRRKRYATIVDLQGLLKSALVARAARGDVRIGPSFCREGSRLLYTAVAGPRNKQRHAVDENLDAVRYLGLPDAPIVFPLRVPAVAHATGSPRIGLVPGARWRTKAWPSAAFRDCARRVRTVRPRARFYLFGGPDDAGACAAIEAGLGASAENLCGRTSLVETGGYLREMDVVLANDTGPLHMAAALGRPCVALYGPTDPVRTGPYGAGHAVLTPDRDCRPCFSRTCRVGGVACLQGIPPERVAEAVLARCSA
jgi:heptosyltransferase I